MCVPTVIKETKEALLNTNNAIKDLKKSIVQLNTSLSDVKSDLEQSLSDPLCSVPPVTTTCNEITMTLHQLDNNTDLRKVRRRGVIGTAGYTDQGLRPPFCFSDRSRREGIMRNPFSRVLCD